MALEKSKGDELSELYALRGGLSAISVEYGKVQRVDGEYYEKLNDIADKAGGARYEAPKGTLDYGMWLLNGSFERELHNRLNAIQDKKISDNNYQQDEAEARTAKRAAAKHFVLFTLFLIIGGAYTAALITVAVVFKMFNGIFSGTVTQNATDGFALVLTIAPAIAGLILTIVFLKKGIDDARLCKKYRELIGLKKDLTKAEEIAARQEVSEKRTAAIKNIDRLPLIRGDVQKVLGERNAAIAPKVQCCNLFYQALLDQFSAVLDERDWKYLDLVIYQIETRRADSVKEALQLVDRELQTERLQRTIGEAAQAVCYTIARGFNKLQVTIEDSCNKICSRLDDISDRLDGLSKQMTVQNIQLADLRGRLACLTDSVNVSNALQARANVTSEQLCYEARAVMGYR